MTRNTRSAASLLPGLRPTGFEVIAAGRTGFIEVMRSGARLNMELDKAFEFAVAHPDLPGILNLCVKGNSR